MHSFIVLGVVCCSLVTTSIYSCLEYDCWGLCANLCFCAGALLEYDYLLMTPFSVALDILCVAQLYLLQIPLYYKHYQSKHTD